MSDNHEYWSEYSKIPPLYDYGYRYGSRKVVLLGIANDIEIFVYIKFIDSQSFNSIR
jgi:hypothetical protein